jgi:hypothetical protein
VLVLDEAPEELVRLVGYLEAVTEGLLIDLVTVSSYQVGGSQVLVPQRVDPERQAQSIPPQVAPTSTGNAAADTSYVPGAASFAAVIESAPESTRPVLRRLTEWAVELEREGLAQLHTYRGKRGPTLLPRIVGGDCV